MQRLQLLRTIGMLAISLLSPLATHRALATNNGFPQALASLTDGTNDLSFNYEGHSRRLIVTTPANYKPQNSYPILFCFHGAGGKADQQSQRWSSRANQRGMIVISAEAIRPLAKWNFKSNFHEVEYDDVGFITHVIQVLNETRLANPTRIYATGHSSGGLFCYRLAKETRLFAAIAPMSCGMAKEAHEPGPKTQPVSIMQVIGDQDKSFRGSSNPRITMYSAAKRIEIWRTFNQCAPDPVITKHEDAVNVSTFASISGIEVVFCKVRGEGHHIRADLRNTTDALALDFLLKHQKK